MEKKITKKEFNNTSQKIKIQLVERVLVNAALSIKETGTDFEILKKGIEVFYNNFMEEYNKHTKIK